MAADFNVAKGDLLPSITRTLTDPDGAAVDLTGATVVFRMRPSRDPSAPVLGGLAVIVDATAGKVEYLWQVADTAVPALYVAEWVVTFPDGKEQSFPADRLLRVEVRGNLDGLPAPSPGGPVITAGGADRYIESITVDSAGKVTALSQGWLPRALWTAAQFRVYAVDGDSGDDARTGYSDVVLPNYSSIALKTLTRLREIVPTDGQGRELYVLIKGRAGGAIYTKPDGTTPDTLSLSLVNYAWVTIRGSTDLTDSAADQRQQGCVAHVTGPGAGGAFTADAGSTVSLLNVQGGGLTADALEGFRVRFDANTATVALRNASYTVWSNGTNNLVPSSDFAAVPQANVDTFFIEKPGAYAEEIDVGIYNQANGTIVAGRGACNISGIRFRQNGVTQSKRLVGNAFYFTFVHFEQRAPLLSAVSETRITDSFSHPSAKGSTFGVGGCRFRRAGTSQMFGPGAGFVLASHSYFDDGGNASPLAFQAASAPAIGISSGCIIRGRVYINGTGSGVVPETTETLTYFGRNGVTTARPTRIVGPYTSGGSPVLVSGANVRFDGVQIEGAGAAPAIRVAGGGKVALNDIAGVGNTGYGVQLEGYDATVYCGLRTALASFSSGGDIRTSEGEVVSFASLALASKRDRRNNLLLGLGGWSHLDDEANWPIGAVRHFAIDPENGNDTNLGWSDVSMADAGTKAVKTLDAWRRRLPLSGLGRCYHAAVKSRPGGANILAADGSQAVLDLRNLHGYHPHSHIRATSDFSDATAERLICGSKLNAAAQAASPGGDGVWTVASFDANTLTLTVASGTLPATSVIGGLRVRWLGTFNSALANVNGTIKRVTAGGAMELFYSTLTPAPGDQFVIDEPGATFTQLVSMCSVGETVVNGPSVAGFRFSDPTTSIDANVNVGEQIRIGFCSFAGAAYFANNEGVSIARTYRFGVGAGGGSVTVGGNRFEKDVRLQNMRSLTHLASWHGGNVFYTNVGFGNVFDVYANYYGVQVSFVKCGGAGGTSASNWSLSTCFGPATRPRTQFARNYVAGRLIVAESNMLFYGVDREAGANAGWEMRNSNGARVQLEDVISTVGGNTGPMVDLIDARNCHVTVGLLVPVTSIASTDFRLYGGVLTATLAQLTTDNVEDSAGNVIVGTGGYRTRKFTAGTIGNLPILAADPSVLQDGDAWIRDTGGVRQLRVRINGVTYSTTLA